MAEDADAPTPQTAVFTLLVRDVLTPPPPTISPATTIGSALECLRASRATAVIVTAKDGRPAGLITERDIVRRVALGVAAETCVEQLMTAPVETVADSDRLYRAIARMRRLGFRHMPVVDRHGRLFGNLDLDVALATAADRALRQIDRLTRERTPEGYRAARTAQAEIAAEMLADGLAPVAVLAVIADHNRDIHRALLEACAVGNTPAPVGYTGLILGSGGRAESFLHPDQDNALIIDDYPDAEHTRIDAWFVGLAERFNHALDAAGFPLCRGHVMASNPVWRKTRSQWRTQLSIWSRQRSRVAVLYADLFLDFAAFSGDAGSADELRAHALAELCAHPALLGDMALAHAENTVALTWFGTLPRRFDLKLRGLMPLVGAVRVLALRAGIAATGTWDRIAALRAANVLDGDTADDAAAAFDALAGIALRQQIAESLTGNEIGTELASRGLTRRERRSLIEALRTAEQLQRRARADITGRTL